jgi:hypothetical protein
MGEAAPLTYLEPTQESGQALFMRGIEGSFTMLNLLRFRDVADYSAAPQMAPLDPITGRQAFELYYGHTLPFLLASGGRVDFVGDGGAFFVGPDDECWDLAMLIRHKSVETFVSFASDETYMEGTAHRTAALLDARLLPLVGAGIERAQSA